MSTGGFALKYQSVSKLALCMAIGGSGALAAGSASAVVIPVLTASPTSFAAGSSTDLTLELVLEADPGYLSGIGLALLGYSLNLDFGDGSATAFSGGGPTFYTVVSHSYALPGSYTATLTGNVSYTQAYLSPPSVIGFDPILNQPIFGPPSPVYMGFDQYINANTGLSVTSVPEPDAWGLMLSGLALVGWAARRRAAVK